MECFVYDSVRYELEARKDTHALYLLDVQTVRYARREVAIAATHSHAIAYANTFTELHVVYVAFHILIIMNM